MRRSRLTAFDDLKLARAIGDPQSGAVFRRTAATDCSAARPVNRFDKLEASRRDLRDVEANGARPIGRANWRFASSLFGRSLVTIGL